MKPEKNPLLSLNLVDKHAAAEHLGIRPGTLKKYRLQPNSTLIRGIHYHVFNSRLIRYNLDLLMDWWINRDNPSVHQRTIDMFLASLPSNQPKQRGRTAQ